MAINKFYGVGKKTTEKMFNNGIFTGADLKNKSHDELVKLFGKSGNHYYNIVRGIHTSEVKPNRTRKSIAAEKTFSQNLSSEVFMLDPLKGIADELERRMLKSKTKGKTITLKIKYADFTQQTRSKTIDKFIFSRKDCFPIIKELLLQEKLKDSVRLLGISISNLNISQKKPIWVQLKFDF